MKTHAGIRLFIGTDNEGGNAFRPPRGDYASFPGNTWRSQRRLRAVRINILPLNKAN
ncbi:hypothetical protein M8494_12280 [Serratia ureilytica]